MEIVKKVYFTVIKFTNIYNLLTTDEIDLSSEQFLLINKIFRQPFGTEALDEDIIQTVETIISKKTVFKETVMQVSFLIFHNARLSVLIFYLCLRTYLSSFISSVPDLFLRKISVRLFVRNGKMKFIMIRNE